MTYNSEFKSDASLTMTGSKKLPSCKKGLTKENFRNFLMDESGATAIEYALIAAGISVVIITSVSSIGTKMATRFSSIDSQM